MATFAGLITISPKRKIGTISAKVTLEELATDDLTISGHPVEAGADITDHAFSNPAQVVIQCGWSNADIEALSGFAEELLYDISQGAFGADYVSSVYAQLIALQKSRVPFDVVTGKRSYTNMLIASLAVTTDKESENILMVRVTCKQIIIVGTQVTTLPAAANQANPASTASTQNIGFKQVIPAMPALGGTVSPGVW